MHTIGRGRYARETYPTPRRGELPEPVSQAEWYINAITGSDANPGTAAAPLASFAELRRRWGPNPRLAPSVGTTTDIHIETDLAEGLSLSGTVYLEGQNFLRIFGAVTSVLHSGSITAKTDVNPAGNIPSDITDAAVGDWDTAGPGGTSLINERIRLTSGANIGAVAWLAKRTAATVARTSPFGTQNTATVPPMFFPTVINPGVGDTYEVERLVQVSFIDISVNRIEGNTAQGGTPTAALLEDIEVVSGSYFAYTSDGPKTLLAVRCRINSWAIVSGSPMFSLCNLSAGSVDRLTNVCRIVTCLWNGSVQGFVNVSRGGISIERDTLLQGTRLQILTGASLGSSGFAIFDATVASGDALAIFSGAVAYFTGLVWGSGSTGVGIDVEATGHVAYVAAFKPILTGGGGDTIVGDDGVTAYGAIPLFNVSDGSAIVAT